MVCYNASFRNTCLTNHQNPHVSLWIDNRLLRLLTSGVAVCKNMKNILLCICTLIYFYIPPFSYALESSEQLLSRGTQLLAKGQLEEALSVYEKAVAENPTDYMSHYKRGTAYLALGNVRLAFSDFDYALKLNPNFAPAVKQRASLNVQLGRLDEAKSDYESVLSYDEHAENKISEIEEFKGLRNKIIGLMQSGNYKDALPILDHIVEHIKFDEHIRESRATCLLNLGEVQKGIQELRYGVHLVNDNREGLYKLSRIMYDSGLAVQALGELRDCLRLDQDYKPCSELYKKVKKIAKFITASHDALEAQRYAECIKNAAQITKFESSISDYEDQANTTLCECHAKSKSADGIQYCEAVVHNHPENSDFRIYLAESYLNADRFDDAISRYQQILEKESNNQKAREGINKAQKLLKASKRRNYYKILGVSKTATRKEILSAYRSLAAKYHPDRFSGDEKKKAELKFVEISSAKEVLTDDEKRAKFDNGVDPLDPEQQQYEGPFGNPFGGFSFSHMHPFDGAHFEFHFG